MDKKGDLMWDNILYLIIFILFAYLMFTLVNSYKNGANFYEDFYSKEIANIINNAEPGMEFKIDVTPLVSIALKNSKPLNEIITINNVANEITVSTKPGKGTRYSFFNDVDIVEWDTKNPDGSSNTARFIFKVKERQK